MCEFNRQDVITVAQAMVDNSVYFMDSDYGDFYYCNHCDAKLDVDYNKSIHCNRKDFKHDTNCPVLVAQDLLTKGE